MIEIEHIQAELDKIDINIWNELEEKSRRYIQYFNTNSITNIRVKEKKWLLICFVADTHFGNNGVDYQQARIDAQKIGSCTYAYAIGGGDYIDNFIRTKILEALIDQTTTPVQQIQLLKEYLEFFNNRMILLLGGNHDLWSKSVSGIDWLKTFADQNQIIYHPHQIITRFIFSDEVEYLIKIRHKFNMNSRYNKTHAVKQMLRFGEELFDIGVICHHHDPSIEQTYELGEDRVFIRTGSYKIVDKFSLKCGYNMAKSIMPCVALNPDRREMATFFHLDHGINFVNNMNN